MVVIKDWFFTITKTAISRGSRFRLGDRPSQETMQNLVDTMVSKNIDDKAKESSGADVTTLAGHVVASTSAQVIAFQVPLADRTLAVQPHQLPETVKGTDTTIDLTNTTYGSDFTGDILEISNITPTSRNVYTHKITSAFSNWLAGILSNISVALSNNITQTGTNTSNIAANTAAIAGLTSGTFNGTLPIGAMSDFGGVADPNANFLICDGRSLVRATYPALFAVLSNRFGDGITPGSTFALPNFTTGQTAKGPDASIVAYNTLGKTGGSNSRMLTIYDLPAHKHSAIGNGADIRIDTSGSHNHNAIVGKTGAGGGGSEVLRNSGTIYDVNLSQNVSHTHPNTSFLGSVGYQYDPGVTPQTALDLNTPFVIVNKIIRVL